MINYKNINKNGSFAIAVAFVAMVGIYPVIFNNEVKGLMALVVIIAFTLVSWNFFHAVIEVIERENNINNEKDYWKRIAETVIEGINDPDGRLNQLVLENKRLFDLVPKWISVKNKTPKIVDVILVYCPGTMITSKGVYEGYYQDKRFYLMDGMETLVTHWMPLPFPPENKEGSK
jgi:hypothetical protein